MLALVMFIICAIAGCLDVKDDDDHILITGSGTYITLTFDHINFNMIEIGSAFEAEIIYSENFSIEFSIDDNIEEYLIVEKNGDILKVMLSRNVSYRDITNEVTIKLPDLRKVEIDGAVKADIIGFNIDHSIEMNLQGASRLSADIQTGDLDINVEGASRLTLEGTGGEAEIIANGAANIDLEEFMTGDTQIIADGESTVTVYPNGTLTGSISGASMLYYIGDPTDVDVTENDISSVEKKE
jgi:hypothetical protein